jgi:hypothetical protein
MIVGYARVSTDGQALDAQQTALQSRRGRLVDQSAKPPSAKARKPVSALPPQMGIVLIWPLFSSVARARQRSARAGHDAIDPKAT